jgi:hypothetical protein
MAVILPGYEYLVNVQQNHRTFRIPSIFTFCFHDDDQDRVWYINIKRKWVSIGADFVVESGGKLYSGSKAVHVVIGGCGGEGEVG